MWEMVQGKFDYIDRCVMHWKSGRKSGNMINVTITYWKTIYVFIGTYLVMTVQEPVVKEIPQNNGIVRS